MAADSSYNNPTATCSCTRCAISTRYGSPQPSTTGWVLVLHGPRLGLRVPPDQADAENQRATELASARKEDLVTGGLMHWGQVRTP